MKIIRTDTNGVKLSQDGRELEIFLAGNDDLYMSLSEGNRRIDKVFNDSIDFYIFEKDQDIYEAFDGLYKRVIEKSKQFPTELVTEDEKIKWISDEGREFDEDYFTLIHYNDRYRLSFLRNNENNRYDTRRKSSRRIDIRISNSGSRYKGYNIDFMELYKELQNIEDKKIYRK